MALSDVWTLDVSGLMQYGPYGYGYSHHGGYGGGPCGGGHTSGGSGKNKDGSVNMKWEQIETKGIKKPGPRGYHTANLIGNIMVVIGGSDGKDSFDELWTLDLGMYSSTVRLLDLFDSPTHRYANMDTDQDQHALQTSSSQFDASWILPVHFWWT